MVRRLRESPNPLPRLKSLFDQTQKSPLRGGLLIDTNLANKLSYRKCQASKANRCGNKLPGLLVHGLVEFPGQFMQVGLCCGLLKASLYTDQPDLDVINTGFELCDARFQRAASGRIPTSSISRTWIIVTPCNKVRDISHGAEPLCVYFRLRKDLSAKGGRIGGRT